MPDNLDVIRLPIVSFADGPSPGGEKNTYGLPTGASIAKVLKNFFRKQRDKILGDLPRKPAVAVASIPDDMSVTDWTDTMKSAMTPLIAAYWDESGKRFLGDIGLDSAEWKVTNPQTRQKIENASFAFCEATNSTTSDQLGQAIDRLKASLAEGIVNEGETLDQLTARVGEIFDHAEKWRARRIAASEASRAVHAAQVAAAEESGVVAGFEIMVSADACPLCRRIASEVKQVRLGNDFAVIGDDPNYANIKHPPLHPSCQCSLISILKPEYGGPEDVDWADPLIQPKADPDYEPPPDVTEPRPEPDREQPHVARFSIETEVSPDGKKHIVQSIQ